MAILSFHCLVAKKHILEKRWNAIRYILYWPIAANFKWQWILASLQGYRHDFLFGIIHSWQQERIIFSLSPPASALRLRVGVPGTRNGNLGFLSGKCLLSLLSSSSLSSFVFSLRLFLLMSWLLSFSPRLSEWSTEGWWIFNMAASQGSTFEPQTQTQTHAALLQR